MRRARDELDEAVANRNALITSIDGRRDLAARYLGELQDAHQRLEATLTADDGRIAVPALPIAPFRGVLDWPARGTVLTRFGTAVSRGDAAVIRQGVELSMNEGTGVRAVHDGRVAFADTFTGFGRLVIIEHGPESHSLYGYLSTIDVAPGALVRARDLVGTTGRAPAGPPALYFELRIDARPVDPLQWLKR
jgi:septal ring factor EnvC (AmiA/AmiB activator)